MLVLIWKYHVLQNKCHRNSGITHSLTDNVTNSSFGHISVICASIWTFLTGLPPRIWQWSHLLSKRSDKVELLWSYWPYFLKFHVFLKKSYIDSIYNRLFYVSYTSIRKWLLVLMLRRNPVFCSWSTITPPPYFLFIVFFLNCF